MTRLEQTLFHVFYIHIVKINLLHLTVICYFPSNSCLILSAIEITESDKYRRLNVYRIRYAIQIFAHPDFITRHVLKT